jgi:2-oxoglutarate/2-oxoacid ferredoxin oxidoreductase subunit alpha
MTPVVLLTDGYLANGAEPWQVPDLDHLPGSTSGFGQDPRASSPTSATPTRAPVPGPCRARPGWNTGSAAWRKRTASGKISYDPDNHQKMNNERQEKVESHRPT